MSEKALNTWLDDEEKNIGTHQEFDKLPSLKFEQNKITDVEIDFSKPFQKWTGMQGMKQITKAIIPCFANNQKCNWWVNVRNPIYRELIHRCKEGKPKVKIVQNGTQAATRYLIVD